MDPLGKLLLRMGAITEEDLADALDQQRHTLPLASLCYVLGHSDEETLTRTLSKQCGVPGVVLDRCVIQLDVLEGVPRDLAIKHNVLPVLEDERRIFVAAENPQTATDLLREFQFVRGKTVVPHISLHVTLARTLRACYAARARGQNYWVGPEADVAEAGDFGSMVVVSDVDNIRDDMPTSRAHEAVYEDVTKELIDVDPVLVEAADTGVDIDAASDTSLASQTSEIPARLRLETQTPLSQIELVPHDTGAEVIDLDDGSETGPNTNHEGPERVLIVDDDFATRHLLVKELQPLGYVTATAPSGGEAIRAIKSSPPDLVIIDVMLPEIDGFQICRAIKQSRKYNHIPVILMSAVIDSGRVTDDVLLQYGANAYFEKPLNTDKLRARLKELIRASRQEEVQEDETFGRALSLYRSGRLDDAVDALRQGLAVDPLSAKHHFVLANLLQKKAMIYEAIDEYEATVDLKPDYFPALTRLAYLYYKNGFSAKAIDTWRRALPHCPDVHLRENIEVFMRRLIADMQSEA